jgi:ABC-type arginine/histidine transport system permease subunit
LPSAFRLALPAYSNEVILMLKASALASTITLLDLTGVARVIVSRTFAPYEIFVTAAIFYLLITWVITRGFNWAERRLNPQLRRPV